MKKSQKYPNGYLPKIEYYSGQIAKYTLTLKTLSNLDMIEKQEELDKCLSCLKKANEKMSYFIARQESNYNKQH
jgi:hypothetical protein